MLCRLSCSRLWSVCQVVVVPSVDAVVAVTVVRALLFVFDVFMPRECEGARVTAMLVWGMEEVWFGVCSAGHLGGTRGSGNVSSAADVLGMSVERGIIQLYNNMIRK